MGLFEILLLFVFAAFPVLIYFVVRTLFDSWKGFAEEEFKKNIAYLIYSLTCFTVLAETQLAAELGLAFPYSDALRFALACVFFTLVLLTVRGFSRISELFSFTASEERRFAAGYFTVALLFIFAAAAFVNNLMDRIIVISSFRDLLLVFVFGAFALLTLLLLSWSQKIKRRITENLLVDGLSWNLYTLTFFTTLIQVHVLYELTQAELFYAIRTVAFVFALASLYVSTSHLIKFVNAFSFSKVVSEKEFVGLLRKPGKNALKRGRVKR